MRAAFRAAERMRLCYRELLGLQQSIALGYLPENVVARIAVALQHGAMLTEIAHDDGHLLNAKVDVIDGEIILHSRGGAFGKPNLRNPDYRQALRVILDRLAKNNLKGSAIWLDSSIARKWPESDRLLLEEHDFGAPVETLLTVIARQAARKGRPDGESGHGNSTKRLRIGVPGASKQVLQKVIARSLAQAANDSTVLDQSKVLPTSEIEPVGLDSGHDQERTWAEGSLRRVAHLRRERASGLAKTKKQAFAEEHGFLYCERCKLIPSEYFGPHGDACIEVHHDSVAVADMDAETKTKLSDLKCLCANCHRIIHRERFGAEMLSDHE